MINILYTLLIYPITQIIELVFTFSQKVFKEPGISVLAVSAVISLLCLPLYNAAEKWQEVERNTVKMLKRKIDLIKAVFSGDERFMILQTFYRQNHYHPAYAMRSTLGLLLQIPFFIAAYSYLSGMEALKGASFLFIQNLGAPDRLVHWGNFTVNILPLLMTAINIISGTLYTKGFPAKDKIQLYGMAVLFLVLLYNSPSALVIYWTMNNIFSLVKNIYYKISFKKKKSFIALFSVIFLVFLVIYLVFFYHGNYFLRILISVVCALSGVFIAVTAFYKKLLDDITTGIFSRWFRRESLPLFIISLVTLWALTGLFIPSTVIASSPQEFSYIDQYTTPLYFIGNTCLQAAGICILWPLFLYFLLKKYQRGFSVLSAVFLFCSLVNVFVFPGRYGVISLELVFDRDASHNLHNIAINLAVLVVPVLLVVFLYRIRREKIIAAAAFFCFVSITGISLYNLIQINGEFKKVKEYRSTNLTSSTATEIAPIFNFSKNGRNTVVIMLDRAVSLFVSYIFEEDPELKEKFSGFIYYPNTVSFNNYTSLGAPPLFGGYEYTPFEVNRRDNTPLVVKHNEALLLMPRIFSEAGYKVTVTDPPYPNYSSRDDLQIYNPYSGVNAMVTDSRYTGIWLKEHDLAFASVSDILKRNLLWYSLFRISPLALRQGIYLQGDYCAPGLMKKMTLTINGYAVLDYLPRLTGISPEKEDTALIMVNNTTHEPSFLQAPDYRPASIVTNFGSGPFRKEPAYHVNAASMKRLGEWFEFLKANNIYDNTKIIIVSDHGAAPNYLIKTSLPFNVEWFNALLMVKDFNASDPIETDQSFMSNADVPFIAFNGQIEKPVNPFTGKSITTDMKLNPLYIAVSGSINLENPASTKYTLNIKKDYYVHTNIFDSHNWTKAETNND